MIPAWKAGSGRWPEVEALLQSAIGAVPAYPALAGGATVKKPLRGFKGAAIGHS